MFILCCCAFCVGAQTLYRLGHNSEESIRAITDLSDPLKDISVKVARALWPACCTLVMLHLVFLLIPCCSNALVFSTCWTMLLLAVVMMLPSATSRDAMSCSPWQRPSSLPDLKLHQTLKLPWHQPLPAVPGVTVSAQRHQRNDSHTSFLYRFFFLQLFCFWNRPCTMRSQCS